MATFKIGSLVRHDCGIGTIGYVVDIRGTDLVIWSGHITDAYHLVDIARTTLIRKSSSKYLLSQVNAARAALLASV